jgi:preprotein translocase subunit SecY
VAESNQNPAAVLSDAARFGDVRKRLLFLIGGLIVYRIGTYIPVPGIDPQRVADFFRDNAATIFGIVNMFSGGALERLSIFTMGVMPYISASIIVQMMAMVVPQWMEYRKEGESGRRKLTEITRYGTLGLALFQSFVTASGLQTQGFVVAPGWQFLFVATITMTTGAMFLMWLGEQITERGVGNGISMIILGGIVAGIPGAVGQTLDQINNGAMSGVIAIALILMVLGVTAFCVFVERAQRRIPVDYAKRQVGRRMMQSQSTHLPFKINMSGVIPPIFASSLLLFPATIAGFAGTNNDTWWGRALETFSTTLGYGQPAHLTLYADLIIFFCFFYTALVFNARETADNLKEVGRLHPRHPPGPADRRVHRQGAHATHVVGRAVHHRGVPAARDPGHEGRHAVRVRRHVAAHRGRGRHGFLLAADRAHAVAPVRQPHEARESHGLRPQWPASGLI